MSNQIANRTTGFSSGLWISAHGRVHLGLLQLSHEFGVSNMGVGFAVERPRWLLRVARARGTRDCIYCPQKELLTKELQAEGHRLLETLSEGHGLARVEVEVVEGVPPHIGLGSKTSLLCALLAAKTGMAGAPDSWPSLRHLTGRGGTSGIGINVSKCGGFLLDAGHRERGTKRKLGPSSSRSGYEFPAVAGRWDLPEWPVLLVRVRDAERYYGRREELFFERMLPLSRRESEQVAGVVLFELIPAVANREYEGFTAAVCQFQDIGFKAKEWGVQDERVREVRKVAEAAGADCVALSSMGPTVVVFGRDLENVHNPLCQYK